MKPKKIFLLLVLISNIVWAQTNPKTGKEKEQAQIEHMMIQAMKQQGMSQEEIDEAIKEYRSVAPVMEEMKEAGVKANTFSTELKIPVKQTKLLTGLPTLTTESSVKQYISNLSNEAFFKIPTEIKTKAEQIWKENNYSKETGMLLFLKGQLKSAVYIMLKTVEKYPDDDLVKNNLAFVLAQSGYPQKAIPLQQHLYTKIKNDNTANNLGQSYLALGDIENAKKYFAIGLGINPNHFEMNCGMGLIEAEKGDPVKANIYIKKALQKGYTPAAEQLAKKTKLKLSYSEIEKPQVPEYFNACKFKPVRATDNWKEILIVEQERETYNQLLNEWYQKREEATQNANTDDFSKLAREHMGLISGPFAKKALFMLKLIGEEQNDLFATKKILMPYINKEKAIKQEFDNKLNNMYKTNRYENAAEECGDKVTFLKEYLSKSKENHDDAERELLPKMYDWLNQSLFWSAMLQSGDQYQATYVGYVHDFIGRMISFDQFQELYPTAESIAIGCENYEQELKEMEKIASEEETQNCPLNIKLKSGIADFKVNCKGYEIEGGELAKFSFEKDSKTGEFQIAFGLGIDGDIGVLSAGAKGMMYMRFGSDFMPVDMGASGEAGIEAQLGVINVEEKLKGTMGIGSINVDAIHHGDEYKIFNADATKDSRDDAAAIKPIKN